ncbi:MAG: hypothetical protein ACK5LP_10280 [Campylobacteraceae bacterium]
MDYINFLKATFSNYDYWMSSLFCLFLAVLIFGYESWSHGKSKTKILISMLLITILLAIIQKYFENYLVSHSKYFLLLSSACAILFAVQGVRLILKKSWASGGLFILISLLFNVMISGLNDLFKIL